MAAAFAALEARAEAGVTVTDEMVERAESAYDAWVSQKDSFAEHTLCNPEAMRFALEAALTGGASHSTARVTEAEDVSVRTLHDDAMKACDEQRWADAVENEALALGRAVRLNVSARTRHTLAKSLISICTTIEKAALTGGASDGE
jgi:post-segregation antitoxin (ccd killing protein)